jgi:dTDP-4-dehydrorhamnose 3,5-epimerase-like enzyme
MKKKYSDWKIKKTNLLGVLKIELTSFEDHRGSYIETYNKNFFIHKGIKIDFLPHSDSLFL